MDPGRADQLAFLKMFFDANRGIRRGVDVGVCTCLTLLGSAPRSRARQRVSPPRMPVRRPQLCRLEIRKFPRRRRGLRIASASLWEIRLAKRGSEIGACVDKVVSVWVAASARCGPGHNAIVTAARPNAAATHKDTQMSFVCAPPLGGREVCMMSAQSSYFFSRPLRPARPQSITINSQDFRT